MKSIFTKSIQTDRTIRAISEKQLKPATATAAPSEGKQTTAVTAVAAAGLSSFVSNE